MERMFANSPELESLDLSHFDTSNVTNMSSMFERSSNLEFIYVSDKFST
jgi:surface protein